jgi:hypothetical protein
LNERTTIEDRLTSSSVIGLCIIVMVDSSASQDAQNFAILSASSKKGHLVVDGKSPTHIRTYGSDLREVKGFLTA